jgi:hypothetical protein
VSDCFPGADLFAAGGSRLFRNVFFRGQLIESLHLLIHDLERALRAFAEAGPKAVAVFFRYEPCLAIHNLDGALGAGGNAQSATVAFFRIDFDDLPDVFHFALLIFFLDFTYFIS